MTNSASRAVVLDRVSKAFQSNEVVHEVSLTVNAGEFAILLGPSGSGKTTILRMIAGFERPTSGSISIADRDVVDIPPSRRDVGVVFQQLALFPHLSVARNVAFGLEVRGVSRDEIRRRVQDALGMVHLAGFDERMPHQLSGGQQQRVALARALVTRPSVLLLDEPLGSLDKNLRAQMQVEIRRLQEELKISTIMVTHDQEEAMTMGDRIAVLQSGRLEQMAEPTVVYDKPTNRFVATFVGDANLFPVKSVMVEHDILMIRVPIGVVTVKRVDAGAVDPMPAHVMVRPENIRVSPCPPDNPYYFRGTVTSAVFAGSTRRIKVRLDSSDEISCLLPSSSSPSNGSSIQPGAEVFAWWDPAATRLLPP